MPGVLITVRLWGKPREEGRRDRPVPRHRVSGTSSKLPLVLWSTEGAPFFLFYFHFRPNFIQRYIYIALDGQVSEATESGVAKSGGGQPRCNNY